MDYRQHLIDSADEYAREAAELREVIAAYDSGELSVCEGPDYRDVTADERERDADTADFLDLTVAQFRAAASGL